jgi:hypothetical protein
VTLDRGDPVERQVSVVRNGAPATWLVSVVDGHYPHLTVVLTAPDQTWTATGTDLFGALINLREDLDAEEILLCCNGARRNAWASGMQRDMGRGRVVYLLEKGQHGRPRQVGTLEAAPCDQIATVREQKEFYAGWLAQRSAQQI